jgi:DNA invertase Pin-like site-specific DNA recombinase
MKNKICLYARVSTDQQTTGLESQVRALREYCRLNNIKEAELFTDENQSGAKSSRPALDRMMALVAAGEVEKVISYSLSRLGRSTTHLLKLMDEMNRRETKFVSLSERLETETPAGRMIFTVLAAVSQLERELIAERVRNGLANARAKGKQIGRKKLRDSLLIRSLLKAGMSFRQISVIAKCSHGSVSAEKAALRKEEAASALAAEQKEVNQIPAEPSIPLETTDSSDEPKIVFVELSQSTAKSKNSTKQKQAA